MKQCNYNWSWPSDPLQEIAQVHLIHVESKGDENHICHVNP